MSERWHVFERVNNRLVAHDRHAAERGAVVIVRDRRCPRCFQSGMLSDDGAVTPHMRLFAAARGGSAGSRWVWCVPVVRSSRRRITELAPDAGDYA